MSTIMWIVVVACLVVLLMGFALLAARIGTSGQLMRRFGPEYDRLVEETGDRRQAERMLSAIVRTRNGLTVTPLDSDARSRLAERWKDVQARFVDDPAKATDDADRLIVEAMTARGYRTDDPAFGTDAGFATRADLLSCDHPETVAGYRSAHATRTSGEGAGTERLRTALMRYRDVFVRVVGENVVGENGHHPHPIGKVTDATANSHDARPKRDARPDSEDPRDDTGPPSGPSPVSTA